MSLDELKDKYKDELLNFENSYKNSCTYSNEKILVYSTLEYRSDMYAIMRLSDINSECDILVIEEKENQKKK